ncbi:MAG: alpha/beta fold hydrolase [Thermoleophilia bacterium]|nr:alpha/beta fold hydrolase [Thermoleophilia bacterium]
MSRPGPRRPPRRRIAAFAVASAAWAAAAGTAAAAPLSWTPCDGPFECATLPVPLDRTAAEAGTLDVAVIRLPASDPAARIGSLVVNPGGPGGSGVDFVRDAGTTLFATLNRRFDIVGFDPRGTGASRTVVCLDDAGQEAANSVATAFPGAGERDAIVARARVFQAACRANSGDLLRHITTASVARDMDLLRDALGDARLTYLGFSYGTYLGATYAALFPKRVRALVLDGGLDPTAYATRPLLTDLRQARGFQGAMERFLAWCRLECEFGDGAPEAAFAALLRRADAAPLPGLDTRPVRAAEVLNASLIALYSRQTWPLLAGALQLADLGDGAVVQILSDAAIGRNDDGTYGDEGAAFNAITAADREYPADLAAYDDLREAWAEASPLFGPGQFWPSSYLAAGWPVTPVDRFTGPFVPKDLPPVLVVGTTADPATPYKGSVALAAELGNATLLTMSGDGHTAYGGNSNCVDLRVERYLVSLRVPASGIVCPQQATPPAFQVEAAPVAASRRLRAAASRVRLHGAGSRLLR